MAPDDSDSLLETLTGVVAVATLPAGILAAMFLGGGAAGVVFVVGWLLLVPVLGVLSDRVDGSEHEDDPSGEEDDALQRLRERYAAGEIGEAEFERRVERLLVTEDRDALGSTPTSATGETDAGRGDDARERGVERGTE